jgi:hypothetical protein
VLSMSIEIVLTKVFGKTDGHFLFDYRIYLGEVFENEIKKSPASIKKPDF